MDPAEIALIRWGSHHGKSMFALYTVHVQSHKDFLVEICSSDALLSTFHFANWQRLNTLARGPSTAMAFRMLRHRHDRQLQNRTGSGTFYMRAEAVNTL